MASDTAADTESGDERIRSSRSLRDGRAVPAEIVFVPIHFGENAANMLTNPACDPIAKIPEFKVCAANIEKMAAAETTQPI